MKIKKNENKKNIYYMTDMTDMIDNSNDNICEQFLYIVDTAIEQGNPNILQKAIKEYEHKISDRYINMAKTMYQELILEKIEDMII